MKKDMAAHVLSCQDDDAMKVFHGSIEAMDEWMVKAKTIPEVGEAIKQAFLSWQEGQELPLLCQTGKNLWRLFPKNKLGGRPSWRAAFPLCGKRLRIDTTIGWEHTDWEDDGPLH